MLCLCSIIPEQLLSNELALSARCSCVLRPSGKGTVSLVTNTVVLRLYLIDRHHPGDDQRDTSINREEDAGRHSGTAETGRGGQPARLSGSHAGKTLCFCSLWLFSTSRNLKQADWMIFFSPKFIFFSTIKKYSWIEMSLLLGPGYKETDKTSDKT